MSTRAIGLGLFIAAILIAYSALSLFEPLPTPQPESGMYTTHERLVAIEKAQEQAKEIAGKPCTLDEVLRPNTYQMKLTVTCEKKQYRLQLDFQHLRFSDFSKVTAQAVGPIEFKYEKTSLNEAGDASPHNDENPAFYLTPALKSQGPIY